MAYRQGSHKVHKVMIQPINVIFRHLQNRTRVSVWVYEAIDLKIEGIVVGFDEYMNICLDEAQEVVIKKGKVEKRKEIGESKILHAILVNPGRILLKGDNVTLIQPIAVNDPGIVA